MSHPERRLLIPRLQGGAQQSIAAVIQKFQHELLHQPDAVAGHIFGGDVVDKHVELLPLVPHLELADEGDAVHHLPQGRLVQIQCHLVALNLGHIQHIVDEFQQMLAGQGDFFRQFFTCYWLSMLVVAMAVMPTTAKESSIKFYKAEEPNV